MKSEDRLRAWLDGNLRADSPLTSRALVELTEADPGFVEEWIDLSTGDGNHMPYQVFVEGSIGMALETSPTANADQCATPHDWISHYEEMIRRWRELGKSCPEYLFDEQGNTPEEREAMQARAAELSLPND